MATKGYFNNSDISELQKLISQPRFDRYLKAAGNDPAAALALYQWNLELSGELLKILHLCEIGLRNGIAEALEAIHGPNWPKVQGFVVSLQNPSKGYSPRKDLTAVANKQASTGKVISELRFAFWERMLNAQHQNRIWDAHLQNAFPNLDYSKGANAARDALRQKVIVVRSLRNRIAHHEPIFYRVDLSGDFRTIVEIVEARSKSAASWIAGFEKVTELISTKPHANQSR